jgi:long-chain acyl-CoA synthetase
VDEAGCLFIVGRKKDVFNCSEGSNVYPARVELLLENDPFIRQAILIGDQRPFMAALIVADRSQIASDLKKPESCLTVGDVRLALAASIRRVNEGLEYYEQIRDFRVLASDFPIDLRQVTIYQKIKIDRSAVADHYAELIDSIYGTALSAADGITCSTWR